MFSGITPVVLKKSIEGSLMRHEAIAHNIANVDTPKFKRVDVDFKTQLKKAVNRNSTEIKGVRTHSGHIEIGSPNLNDVSPIKIRENKTSMRIDENNVDIDVEMGALSQNTTNYSVLVRLVSDYYSDLETAIRGRS